MFSVTLVVFLSCHFTAHNVFQHNGVNQQKIEKRLDFFARLKYPLGQGGVLHLWSPVWKYIFFPCFLQAFKGGLFFFFFFTEMCMINAVVFPSQQLMLCQPSSIFVIKWEQRLKPSYLPLSTAFVQVSLKFPLHIDCHVSLQLYILPVHTSAIVFLAERLLSFSPKYLVPSMVQNGSSIDLQLTGSYSSSPNWQWFLQQSVCRTFQETGNHHYPMVYILYLFSFLSFLT